MTRNIIISLLTLAAIVGGIFIVVYAVKTDNKKVSIETDASLTEPSESTSDTTVKDSSDSSAATSEDVSSETSDTEFITDEETTEPEITTAQDTEDTVSDDTSVYDGPEIKEFTDKGFVYSIDVSEYLGYIDPKDNEPYLIIISREHPTDSDVIPKDITSVGHGNAMRKYAAKALKAMMYEMESKGITVGINSCYRDFNLQNSLYQNYLNKTRKAHPKWTEEQITEYVHKFSTPAGTSEHHTGLAIDFSPVNYDFEKSDAFAYLTENAYKFGFILRYTDKTTDITGCTYEPWHWRFVGRKAANYIYTHGNMTLEEYYYTVAHPELGTESPEPQTSEPETTLPDTSASESAAESTEPDETSQLTA